MTPKHTLVLILIIAVVVTLGLFALPRTANTPGNVSQSVAPTEVETYVTANISTLSPVHEQLGGTFYVTAIEADNGRGTVSYEDGHNAYTADFTYTADAQGSPRIDSFEVRE